VGRRWNNPDYLAELAEADRAPELIKFWRAPVFREKFYNVPVFLLPRLSQLATEVPGTDLGRRIYYERAHALLVVADVASSTQPAAFDLDAPPSATERKFGFVVGQAFHEGCSLADVSFAARLPSELVVAIGKRTIQRTEWLNRL